MTALARYEAARSALAEARSIDEVKDVLDRAEALRHYGRIANDDQLVIDASEIRMRAERRLGIMLGEAKSAGQLRTGKDRKSSISIGTSEEPIRFTLDEIGVDKKLSARAQKVGGIAEQAFEAMVGRMRQQMTDGNRRVSLNLMKEDEADRRRRDDAARVYSGGTVDDLFDLAASGWKAGAILADPPWHFMTHSAKGDGRSAGTHYKTEENGFAKMKALPVADMAADDCILFMWMVDWAPQQALDLISAWGFTHKTTAFTWAKQTASGDAFHMGQGYWTRANPEACWLATRGHPERLHADVRQLIVAPVAEHSRKPEFIHDMIERLVGGPYLELYARRPRDKWTTWGNETAFIMPDILPHDPDTGEIIEASSDHSPDVSNMVETHEPGANAVALGGQVNPDKNDGGGAGALASPPSPDRSYKLNKTYKTYNDADLEIPNFLRRPLPDCIVKDDAG